MKRFSGSDTLTITTNDGGATGTGGTLQDSDTVAITVTGVNDAPVLNSAATPVLGHPSPAVRNRYLKIAYLDTTRKCVHPWASLNPWTHTAASVASPAGNSVLPKRKTV